MAEGTTGGNNGMLYFIVGVLCVVVAIGAFFMLGGQMPGSNQAKSVDVKIQLPAADKK